MATLEEVRAKKEALIKELEALDATEQEITAAFNFEERPAEIRAYTAGLKHPAEKFEWVDDTHFVKLEYVHGSNKEEFGDEFYGPDGQCLFGEQFQQNWRYALYEVEFKLLVNAIDGTYVVLEVDGKPLKDTPCD